MQAGASARSAVGSGSPQGALPGPAGNRRFWLLSALCAHTEAPYKIDFHRKTLRALNHLKVARTVLRLVLPQRQGRLLLNVFYQPLIRGHLGTNPIVALEKHLLNMIGNLV